MSITEIIKNLEVQHPYLAESHYWFMLKGKFFKKRKAQSHALSEMLIEYICEFEDMDTAGIYSPSRKREFAYTRYCIWYLIHKYFRKAISLSEMAQLFNRKTHGNVLKAIDDIGAWVRTDKKVRDDIGLYEELLLSKGVINIILPYYEREPRSYKYKQLYREPAVV